MRKKAFAVVLAAILLLLSCSTTSLASNGDDAPAELSLFVAGTWESGIVDSSLSDPVIQAVQEGANVKLNISFARSDNPMQEVALMMSSNSLTDMIVSSDAAVRQALVSGGYIQKMDDLIESSMPNTKKRLAPFFEYERNKDGNLYGFPIWTFEKPTKYSLNLQVNTILLRYDLMKEMGYDVDRQEGDGKSILTMDEYMAIVDAGREKYPDLIPIMMNTEDAYNVMTNAHGYRPCNSLVGVDGNWHLRYDNPSTMDDILFFNRLVREGYVPSDYAMRSREQCVAEVSNGDVFSYFGHFDGIGEANASQSSDDPERRFVFYYLRTSDDIEGMAVNGAWSIGEPNYMISSNTNQLEACARFVDYCYSEEGSLVINAGVEGISYTVDASGKKIPVPEVADAVAAWDAEGLKKSGVGGWLCILPTIVGVDEGGNVMDINAQRAFESDPWVIFNNTDWRQISYTQILHPYLYMDPDTQQEAIDSLSKINVYLFDRMTQAIMMPDEESCRAAWAETVQQMDADGKELFIQEASKNLEKVIESLGTSVDKIYKLNCEQ